MCWAPPDADHDVIMTQTTRLSRPPVDPGPTPWVFPPPDQADLHGLVGVGADFAAATLVAAYRTGVFPWPDGHGPVPWYSPDPRAVFDLSLAANRRVAGVHVSRSLRRRLQQCGWTTTADRCLEAVVDGCASERPDGTWLVEQFRDAYATLGTLGWAHSLEVWDRDRLVGGIMGIGVGAVFTAESMFSRSDDASKVALLALAVRLRQAGAVLLDAQVMNPHLDRMGAVEIPRAAFLQELERTRDRHHPVALARHPVAALVA